MLLTFGVLWLAADLNNKPRVSALHFIFILFNPVYSRAHRTASETTPKCFKYARFSDRVNFYAPSREIPDVPAHSELVSLFLGKEAKANSLDSSGDQI
jgi:hypothetical protein